MRQALTWKELWTVKNERVLHLKQNLQPASESPGLCSHLCKNTQGNDLGITGFRNHAGEFEALVAQTRKNLLAVQETQVQTLGQEDPPEKVMATYSSILAWRIPRTEEPSGLQSMGSQKVGHD